uniref:Uncharacterized protein n=1 Tax=Anguilla anguilla TaxID=7936 RepID=A0A0E9R3T7_ANGAN
MHTRLHKPRTLIICRSCIVALNCANTPWTVF